MKAFKLTMLFLSFLAIQHIAAVSVYISSGVPVYISSGVLVFGKALSSELDTARLNHLIRTGFINLKLPEGFEKAEACIDSATMLCERSKIDIPPLLHLLKAKYNFGLGDYSNSEEEAKIAMETAENSGENRTLAESMDFLGRYYHKTGAFKESIDYFEKSIALSKEKGLKGIIAWCYFGQADVYNSVRDLAGYRKNLRLMIDEGISENDLRAANIGYYYLGTSYCGDSPKAEGRDFNIADSLLRRGLEISLSRKDNSLTASSLANIGWNFYLENMYDSSLTSYNKSLKYSISNKLDSVSANSFGNIGTIYRDLGNFKEAILYYTKAIDHAKVVDDWYNLQWIYMDISNMYINSGDTSNAYKNYVQYKKYSDAWLKSENVKGLTDARIRYEADTHNKEVALLSLRLKNNRMLNIGFTGFIILMITIGFLIFRGSKIEARRRMSEMNRKISELTQANLRQQMNPHFIFNTLNSIQYYMYQHDKLATNTYLTKFSSLMRKVLDNSNHTSIPLRDELDALTLYLDLERLRFKDKFRYEINIDEEIDPLLFKVPTMLIQPYVENSICHGLMPKEGNGIIRIDMKMDKDHIICTIEDNGIGREAAMEKKKMKNTNHNSLGTRIASSRLDLVNSLYGSSLHTIYTDLKNENDQSIGTRVEIHIPIMT